MAAAGVPNIVIAASKQVFDRKGGPSKGGYRERDLIIALYNLESDATWSGDNYYGDPNTLDYVHRTDILDAGGSTALADLDRRNDCEGPALFERNHIQMSVDREIRKVNENPEVRGGGVIDTGACVNDFAVTVTVWTGAAYESKGREDAGYVQLTCRFDGTANDDFRALPWDGEHEGPGWYYHEYVLCTDANGGPGPGLHANHTRPELGTAGVGAPSRDSGGQRQFQATKSPHTGTKAGAANVFKRWLPLLCSGQHPAPTGSPSRSCSRVSAHSKREWKAGCGPSVSPAPRPGTRPKSKAIAAAQGSRPAGRRRGQRSRRRYHAKLACRRAADAATITMIVGVTNVNTTTAITRWDANLDTAGRSDVRPESKDGRPGLGRAQLCPTAATG